MIIWGKSNFLSRIGCLGAPFAAHVFLFFLGGIIAGNSSAESMAEHARNTIKEFAYCYGCVAQPPRFIMHLSWETSADIDLWLWRPAEWHGDIPEETRRLRTSNGFTIIQSSFSPNIRPTRELGYTLCSDTGQGDSFCGGRGEYFFIDFPGDAALARNRELYYEAIVATRSGINENAWRVTIVAPDSQRWECSGREFVSFDEMNRRLIVLRSSAPGPAPGEFRNPDFRHGGVIRFQPLLSFEGVHFARPQTTSGVECVKPSPSPSGGG